MKERIKAFLVIFLPLLLFAPIPLSAALRSCGPSAQEQIETIKKAKILEITQLVEENGDFFDMLLDVRRRMKAVSDEESDLFIPFDSLRFSIRNDEYVIDVFIDTMERYPEYNDISASEAVGAVLTVAEEEMIKKALLELLTDERTSIQITPNNISIWYTLYKRTVLYIGSPAQKYERKPNESSYEGCQLAIKINDDWCIYIFNASRKLNP